MRYSAEDPYKLLTESGLPYVATERFALDQLLGHSVRSIDRYIVYVPATKEKEWQSYLHGRAQPVSNLGNLVLISDYSSVANTGQSIPDNHLAKDLVLMAPRYVAQRGAEIQIKAPALWAEIMQCASLGSSTPPDNFLEAL